MGPEPKSEERFCRQYDFGDFTLDLDGRVLRRAGKEVNLRPKSFDVLAHLVHRHGSLVTKAELMETVWPDTAVTRWRSAWWKFDGYWMTIRSN